MNIFLAAALLFLLIQGIFGPHGAVAMYRTKNEVRQLQLEIEKLNQENRRLADQVKSLKSDPATIERIARDEMGLARPGELVFKVQDRTQPAATPVQPPGAPSTQPPPAHHK